MAKNKSKQPVSVYFDDYEKVSYEKKAKEMSLSISAFIRLTMKQAIANGNTPQNDSPEVDVKNQSRAF